MKAELEQERSTTAEAKNAVDAIRTDVQKQLQQEKVTLANVEETNGKLRAELEKLSADVSQREIALKANLEEERQTRASLQVELQREQAELSKAKDAIDVARAEANWRVQAKQKALAAQESEANLKAEIARTEIERLRSAQEKTGLASVEVHQLQAKVEEERKAKDVAEADRSRLLVSERETKAEIERLRSQLSVLSTRGKEHGDEAERLRLKLEEAGERQQKLDAELARLRKLLSEREAIAVKPADMPAFTTDAPRPASLYDRRPDSVDDLKEVKGIGPVMERVLNENGCFHFKQLANFSLRDIEWISQALGSFPDRIERDGWVGQAKTLYLEKYGKHHTVGAVRTLETVS